MYKACVYRYMKYILLCMTSVYESLRDIYTEDEEKFDTC